MANENVVGTAGTDEKGNAFKTVTKTLGEFVPFGKNVTTKQKIGVAAVAVLGIAGGVIGDKIATSVKNKSVQPAANNGKSV